jgi:hypothetical protein
MCLSTEKTFAEMLDGLDSDLSDAEMVAAPSRAQHTATGVTFIGDDPRKPFPDAASALKFMTAGKSTVTLVSLKTEKRYTYRITASEDGLAHFVGVLTGSDNESSYSYLGRISRGIFWQGRKVPKASDVAKGAPSHIAFDWAWRAMSRGDMPESLQVWHEYRCGRCARKLTVPSSIASGYGPECQGKI